ncbi:Serine/threonine-protein kinase PrkC [Posidoniimonas corsicana]|uniref:non-specific serine/threonine protein kinase n=1 Tax=Posidoniimonas corsicana TaxID=1938618 RepID=A0A5C5V3U3_9BACT|nr:serine/threonine-protein kinase [Posidoniimonas corsicana]TWT32427.1 Serine/threonine-protein kinase PrkC [Posidoniimonas corsicana]
MTPDQYAKVRSIFLEACDLEKAERDAFVATACDNDDALKQEVLSLLEYHSPDTLFRGDSDTNLPHPRRVTEQARQEWVGRQIDKYTVSRVLDSGGMGTVLEAHDAAIDRHVAIKVLHPDLARDESMRRRFTAEARAAGRLSHQNVVTIYEVGSEGDHHFLVMEYAEGGSADDHIRARGAYPLAEATRIITQACQGLAAAHEAGLVHRDIKPANLLLRADGVVKVSDFGIAKLANDDTERLTALGQLVGTPNFMSPEQCEGTTVDFRSDVYSMGAAFYTLLTGRYPYGDCTGLLSLINAHCNLPPPDPRDLDPGVPASHAAVIKRAMAIRPEDRFADASEMLAALRSLDTDAPHEDHRPNRRTIATGLAGVALAAAAGVAYQLWPRRGDRGGLLGAGGPVTIKVAHSTEKAAWFTWAAAAFARTRAGRDIKVDLLSIGSLRGASRALDGSREDPIHVWCPSSSLYQAEFERRWRERHGGASPLVNLGAVALTPIVLVIWKDRLDAVERAYGEFGLAAIAHAVAAEEGWETIAAEPDWGDFKIGIADPEQTISGLAMLFLMAYNYHDKRRGLTRADVVDPGFHDLLSRFTVHLFDTLGSLPSGSRQLMSQMVLEGPGRYDCAVVYENLALHNLEVAGGRWEELRVVYPELNFLNDNPYYLLNADWTGPAEKSAAEAFAKFLMTEAVQEQAIEFGFRPGNVKVSCQQPDCPFVRLQHLGVRPVIDRLCERPKQPVVAELQSEFTKLRDQHTP